MSKFNGYLVLFYSHDYNAMMEHEYVTEEYMMKRFKEIVSPEDFANDLYDCYGDIVLSVCDSEGRVLYDNLDKAKKEITDIYGEVDFDQTFMTVKYQ